MSTRCALLALMLLAAPLMGCAKDPFRPTPLPKLSRSDPPGIVNRFESALADRFTSADSVIIHVPFRDDLALLGVVQVDRVAGTFELVGLNQMGVQFFHLSGDRKGSSIRSAVPPLMKHKQILLSIADDTRRMYFDLLPGKDALADSQSNMIRFIEKTRAGKLIRTFGGDPGVLLEKRLSGWLGTNWKVRYFEYALKDGKQYPRGIILNNGRYHYRITVRNREWQIK